MMCAMRLALASLSLLTAAFGQAPAGYYSAVVTTTPAQLRATLHDVIDDHARVPFSSSSPGANVWSVLEVADQDPADPTRILDVYRNRSYAEAGGLNFGYFPESAWPAVYGFPNDNADNFPYSDYHRMFLCNVAYQLFRAFKVFDIGIASNGACKGRLSTDIRVTEDNSTPVGASLQLTGVGEGYAQFQWTLPTPQTPGAPNTNQNFL